MSFYNCYDIILKNTQPFIKRPHFHTPMLFNEDGSLKLDPQHEQKIQTEKNAILFEKFQINDNNPAVAQLHIEFPFEFNDYDNLEAVFDTVAHKYSAVEKSIRRENAKTIIIEARDTKQMYEFLESLIVQLQEFLKKDADILVKGNWVTYGYK